MDLSDCKEKVLSKRTSREKYWKDVRLGKVRRSVTSKRERMKVPVRIRGRGLFLI